MKSDMQLLTLWELANLLPRDNPNLMFNGKVLMCASKLADSWPNGDFRYLKLCSFVRAFTSERKYLYDPQSGLAMGIALGQEYGSFELPFQGAMCGPTLVHDDLIMALGRLSLHARLLYPKDTRQASLVDFTLETPALRVKSMRDEMSVIVSPIVKLPVDTGFNDYLASLPKGKRDNVKQALKKVEAEYTIQVYHTDHDKETFLMTRADWGYVFSNLAHRWQDVNDLDHAISQTLYTAALAHAGKIAMTVVLREKETNLLVASSMFTYEYGMYRFQSNQQHDPDGQTIPNSGLAMLAGAIRYLADTKKDHADVFLDPTCVGYLFSPHDIDIYKRQVVNCYFEKQSAFMQFGPRDEDSEDAVLPYADVPGENWVQGTPGHRVNDFESLTLPYSAIGEDAPW